MFATGNIFLEALKNAMIPSEIGSGDYKVDGLMICGKCHTPREMRIEILGEEHTVPIMCTCRKSAYEFVEEERKREKQERIRQLIRNSGFDDAGWMDARFDMDDGRDQKASQSIQRYVEHFDQMRESNVGLMLYGGLGCGKTYLAACAANALIDQGYRVMMTSLSNIVASMNNAFGEDRSAILNRIRRYDLLILDDVGIERSTEYMVEQSYAIINERYKSGLPLIITTNLRPDDLRNKTYPEWQRVHDRLIEMCQPMLVRGDSRRIEIAKEKRRKCLEIINGSDGAKKEELSK